MALLLDIEVPRNTRVNEKEQEKVDKYQDLAAEIERLWKVKARVIPIVIGALGRILRGLKENLRILGITIKVELIQKVALLGTARILKVMTDDPENRPNFSAKSEPSSTAEFIAEKSTDKIRQFYRSCVIQKLADFCRPIKSNVRFTAVPVGFLLFYFILLQMSEPLYRLYTVFCLSVCLSVSVLLYCFYCSN